MEAFKIEIFNDFGRFVRWFLFRGGEGEKIEMENCVP